MLHRLTHAIVAAALSLYGRHGPMAPTTTTEVEGAARFRGVPPSAYIRRSGKKRAILRRRGWRRA